MSSRKSNLRKQIRATERFEKKQAKARDKYRKPGESDEEMEARMKRDLFGFVDMMTERQIEEGLLAKAEELEAQEAMQSTTNEEQ